MNELEKEKIPAEMNRNSIWFVKKINKKGIWRGQGTRCKHAKHVMKGEITTDTWKNLKGN